MMVRTVGDDAPEQKVIDDIATYGWHCVGIHAEGDESPFAFTVGLFQTFGHPEFIIFGLASKVAHQILGLAVNAIRSGAPLDLSLPTDQLLEGYPCCFVRVPESQYHEHVGFAVWYYRGDSFPLYQIVFPSRDGHFPWHPEATASFRDFQPVLGRPQLGA
jgi:hypothetical protein